MLKPQIHPNSSTTRKTKLTKTPTMNDEEFKKLLGDDVKPLEAEKRINLDKRKTSEASLINRRQAAQETLATPADPLAGEPVEMVAPLDIISFQRPGVQHGVYKNLRMGKYTIDARLDLHKLTVEKARHEIYQFIQDCVANDVRTALVTHGKGEGREKPAMLKSCVAFWLPQIEQVLAFHTAQKQHGSYGATYVLLKKGERKKNDNRERHSKHLPG